MTRRALTEAKIRRAVKGAIDGGLQIGGVDVLPDGTIRLLSAAPGPAQAAATRQPESWADADKPSGPALRKSAVR